MYFANKNKPQQNITVTIDDEPIQQNTNVSFLGLTLDSQLSWESHTQNLRSKLSSVFFN
jgi:hypothetical protein